MRLLHNPSFYALAAVLLGGALVGLPRVSDLSASADRQEDQIASLEQQVVRLVNTQADLQSGITLYRQLLSRQDALLASQNERIAAQEHQLADGFLRLEGLSDSVHAQAVLAASLKPQPSPTPHEAREVLRREILRPVFQVSGEDAVGSAVLVHRGEDEKGPYYLALSCYHVLRDIVANEEGIDPHEVRFDNIFDQMGDTEVIVKGVMVAEKIDADLALLRLDTDLDLGPVASLAPRERQSMVDAFTPVYTVGCPLGTNAQATRGEVTRNDWEVGDQPYWMVSSPAYFGNSGGGVFLEETHELVGIFSKIYTHGNYRPQVVTHMGLAVPLDTIHDWLQDIGYGSILPRNESVAAQVQDAASEPVE